MLAAETECEEEMLDEMTTVNEEDWQVTFTFDDSLFANTISTKNHLTRAQKRHGKQDARCKRDRLELIREQEADPAITQWISETGQALIAGVVCRREADGGTQIVLPKKYRRDVLEVAHDVPVAGHLGTLLRIKKRFWWPGMTKDVAEYC